MPWGSVKSSPAVLQIMAASDVDVLRNRLRACINAILQELNSPNFDSDSHDSVFFRVESLYNTIARFDGAVGIDNNVVSYIRQVRDCLSSHSPTSSARVAEKLSLVIVVDPNI